MIRLATTNDVEGITTIYEKIHDLEEAGKMSIGWDRNIYPVWQTAMDAVKRGDMFVSDEDDNIVAAGIINQIQVPEYVNCPWKYPAEDKDVLTLHTLVVDPHCNGRGYGSEFIGFYEKLAVERNQRYLRLDTNVINTEARKFYKKLGYKEPGVIHCTFNGISDVNLICLEKLV